MAPEAKRMAKAASSSNFSEADNNSSSPLVQGVLRRLDALDKRLSEPIFRLLLPYWLECLCSIPGNMFGVPVFATLVAPNLVAWITTQQPWPQSDWCISVLGALIVVLWIWSRITQLTKRSWEHGVFYGALGGSLGPPLGVLLLSLLSLKDPKYTGYFTIACWNIAVIPIALLKPSCARTRPVALHQYEKHLNQLCWLFSKDASRSFPSGDVAGAVAVAYPLYRNGFIQVAASIVVLSAFGRMYYQAHHLFDVLAGALLALPCCILLEKHLLPNCQATWWQALLAQLILAVSVIATRKILKVKVFASGTIDTTSHAKTT